MGDLIRQPGRPWLALLATAAIVSALSASAEPPAPGAASETHAFQLQFKPDRTIYYVVENEFSDGASISGDFPLAYSDAIVDRRTIAQALPQATAPASRPIDMGATDTRPVGFATTHPAHAAVPPNPTVHSLPDQWTSGEARSGDAVTIEWTCDRYEARERASFRPEVAFDSLRHTYPVAALRGLGTTPGAEATLAISPSTGKVDSVRLAPGPNAGPPTREKLSNTAARGVMNASNTQELAFMFGGYFFPAEPVRIGDTWHRRFTDQNTGIGTVTTDLACTLRSIQERDGTELATIDLSGQMTLEPPPPAPVLPHATTLPAPRIPPHVNRPHAPPQHATSRPELHPPPPALRGARSTAPSSQPMHHEVDPRSSAETHLNDTPRTVSPLRTASYLDDAALPTRPAGREVAPATQPSPPAPAVATTQPRTEERTLDRAVCNGVVIFDLTNGELVELTLRRELELHKGLTGGKPDQKPIEARQNSSHVLRIHRFLTPPPRPFIQGGPQAPVEPDMDAASQFPGRRPPTASAPTTKSAAGSVP